MRLGIFAKTFKRDGLTDLFAAVRQSGFDSLQFNMACAGLPSMPPDIPEQLPLEIASGLKAHGLHMAAVSGTFNMIHPDQAIVQNGLKSLALLIRHARAMGTSNVTLCTGTFDPEDMWRFHPENNSKEAWIKLCRTLETALMDAEAAEVNLLVEPELGNVINGAAKARRLLDEMQSKYLRIVLDPANLFEKASKVQIQRIISEALDLLGPEIEIAHAKDRTADGEFAAAGLGILPYPFFLGKLNATGFTGDLITHGLSEAEVPACHRFLREQMES